MVDELMAYFDNGNGLTVEDVNSASKLIGIWSTTEDKSTMGGWSQVDIDAVIELLDADGIRPTLNNDVWSNKEPLSITAGGNIAQFPQLAEHYIKSKNSGEYCRCELNFYLPDNWATVPSELPPGVIRIKLPYFAKRFTSHTNGVVPKKVSDARIQADGIEHDITLCYGNVETKMIPVPISPDEFVFFVTGTTANILTKTNIGFRPNISAVINGYFIYK